MLEKMEIESEAEPIMEEVGEESHSSGTELETAALQMVNEIARMRFLLRNAF